MLNNILIILLTSLKPAIFCYKKYLYSLAVDNVGAEKLFEVWTQTLSLMVWLKNNPVNDVWIFF